MLQPRKWLRSTRGQSSFASQCLINIQRRFATTDLHAGEHQVVVTEPESASLEPGMEEAPAITFAERPSVKNQGGGMRTYKPRTPGVRHLIRPINDHLWKGRAYLPLTFPRKGQHIGGRNKSGRIMVRHRGGGHKRRIRMVDFERTDAGEHVVERIEYDPGRTAHIALIKNSETQAVSYILAAEGMRAGDKVESYRQGIPKALLESMGGTVDPAMVSAKTAWRGNCLPLHMVPPGSLVYNVGLKKGKGGQLCRSAGTFATVLPAETTIRHKWKMFVNVKLQSGEVRRIHKDACATIGVSSNVNHEKAQLGKAGRSRWLGIRPTVRGVAMNAVDHPHGGGRGKSKGNRHPIDVWGRTLAKGGFKTRKRSNINKAVVVARPRNMGKRKRDKKNAA